MIATTPACLLGAGAMTLAAGTSRPRDISLRPLGLALIGAAIALAATPAWADQYRQAADNGVAFAQHNMGVFYEHGTGVRRDLVEAASWYRKAAEQGNAKSQFNLGLLYVKGDGVEQDYFAAEKWFRLAADQGHSGGQASLGNLYFMGEGVRKDRAQALFWWKKAADQGNEFKVPMLQQ